MNRPPTDRLLALLRGIPAAQAQNRLMRIADREIALAMMYMHERDASLLLARVAPAKARRVREELALQKNRIVKPEVYVRAVANVITQVESSRPSSSLRSYLRPHTRRRS